MSAHPVDALSDADVYRLVGGLIMSLTMDKDIASLRRMALASDPAYVSGVLETLQRRDAEEVQRAATPSDPFLSPEAIAERKLRNERIRQRNRELFASGYRERFNAAARDLEPPAVPDVGGFGYWLLSDGCCIVGRGESFAEAVASAVEFERRALMGNNWDDPLPDDPEAHFREYVDGLIAYRVTAADLDDLLSFGEGVVE